MADLHQKKEETEESTEELEKPFQSLNKKKKEKPAKKPVKEEAIQEPEPPKEENQYHLYFYANSCKICFYSQRSGIDKPLKRCSSCHLVSYCGSEHQAEHWPTHKKLCKIVRGIIAETGSTNLFGYTKGMSITDWVKVKMNAMLIVSFKLRRELTPVERNMFKFPRNCCVCHETNPKALMNCFSCSNSSFCKEHIFDIGHKILCKSFRKGEIVETSKLKNQMKADDLEFAAQCLEFVKLNSMRIFLDRHFEKIINIKGLKNTFWEVYVSENLTRPMTLMSAMKMINFEARKELIIHVLGSNYLELCDIFYWEIIFHLMPRVKIVKLVLFGPELVSGTINKNLCDYCTSQGKIFDIEIHNLFYHDFLENNAKPNIIIGYNLGFSEFENAGSPEDTWKPTILKLAEQNAPFVFTCYSEDEAYRDIDRLCHFLGDIDCSYFLQNKFASMKPIRDFETEGIFYENNFLVIYEKLKK